MQRSARPFPGVQLDEWGMLPASEQCLRLTELLGRLRALRKELVTQLARDLHQARTAERAATLVLIDAAIATTAETLAAEALTGR
jgi:hypothetical protein